MLYVTALSHSQENCGLLIAYTKNPIATNSIMLAIILQIHADIVRQQKLYPLITVVQQIFIIVTLIIF